MCVNSSNGVLRPHTQAQSAGVTHTPLLIPAEVFDGASSEQVVDALKGRKLLGAHRKGKQMWLTLEGDKPNVLMHFGEETEVLRSVC